MKATLRRDFFPPILDLYGGRWRRRRKRCLTIASTSSGRDDAILDDNNGDANANERLEQDRIQKETHTHSNLVDWHQLWISAGDDENRFPREKTHGRQNFLRERTNERKSNRISCLSLSLFFFLGRAPWKSMKRERAIDEILELSDDRLSTFYAHSKTFWGAPAYWKPAAAAWRRGCNEIPVTRNGHKRGIKEPNACART